MWTLATHPWSRSTTFLLAVSNSSFDCTSSVQAMGFQEERFSSCRSRMANFLSPCAFSREHDPVGVPNCLKRRPADDRSPSWHGSCTLRRQIPIQEEPAHHETIEIPASQALARAVESGGSVLHGQPCQRTIDSGQRHHHSRRGKFRHVPGRPCRDRRTNTQGSFAG